MRHRHAPITTFVALCLLAGSSIQPAVAGGLISTERVADSAVVEGASRPESVAQLRAALLQSLVQAGVEPLQAQQRLSSLTDAEVLNLARHLDEAPAGGMWFAPFLVVALVIGALIGSRSSAKETPPATTDLFGRPRSVASAP